MYVGSWKLHRFGNSQNGHRSGAQTYTSCYIIKPTISTGSDGIGEDGNLKDKTVSYVGETETQDDGTTTEPKIQVTCTAPYGSTFVNKKVNKEQMEDDDALMGGAKTTVNGGLTFHGTLVKTFDTNATTGNTDYKMSLNDLKMEGDILAGSPEKGGNVLYKDNDEKRDNLGYGGEVSEDVTEAAKQHNVWEAWD